VIDCPSIFRPTLPTKSCQGGALYFPLVMSAVISLF